MIRTPLAKKTAHALAAKIYHCSYRSLAWNAPRITVHADVHLRTTGVCFRSVGEVQARKEARKKTKCENRMEVQQ